MGEREREMGILVERILVERGRETENGIEVYGSSSAYRRKWESFELLCVESTQRLRVLTRHS